VIHVYVLRHVNYLINCHQVVLLLPWNSYILMFGVLRSSLSIARNIMLALLITTVNLHGSAYCVVNPKCFNVFLSFNLLLSTDSIARLSRSSLIGGGEGGEYERLNSFFHRVGISHHVSYPYTHQQNGVAEHKHHHIIEMGRSSCHFHYASKILG
jgi:hypothetical protein